MAWNSFPVAKTYLANLVTLNKTLKIIMLVEIVSPPKLKPKPGSPCFKPGSAVEVTFEDDGFRGFWFCGTAVRCLYSGRLLVEYHNLIGDEQSAKPLREVIGLHQLRTQPPPENRRESSSGDRVDAFHNDGWWEGHVSRGFGHERFGVYFKESKEHTVFPKEKIRIHRDLINHNWVPPLATSESPNCNVSTIEKETEGKLMMEVKRLRTNGRERRKEKMDRLSDLPDCVLLRIMEFMDTKPALQTCVLSKRWKNLWKRLTTLTFDACKIAQFSKFVSWVLSSRDDSIPLLCVDIMSMTIEPELLDKVLKYVVLHNVQQLKMDICLNARPNFELLPCIYTCRSLTSLKLIMTFSPRLIILPKSLQLPALKTLHLEGVDFAASDNDCVEPFSTCNMLDTLILEHCHFHNDAKVLCISSSTISSFTISYCSKRPDCKFELLTPNLSSFTSNLHYELLPSFSSCWSLTSLKLFCSLIPLIMLPKYLQLPTLKTLHLAGVNFAASDNDCSEPFSTCHMLETLVLEHCNLHNDARLLCISNSSISSLTIGSCVKKPNYKIELLIPSLSSFTITGHSNHQLSSTCNLSSLEEVYIDVFHKTGSIVISWLQVLSNVKILTLSSSNFKTILNDLSTLDSVRIQPPCFIRLTTLKVKMRWPDFMSDEEINSAVKYLLQNSSMATVDIIKDESDVPDISDIITL